MTQYFLRLFGEAYNLPCFLPKYLYAFCCATRQLDTSFNLAKLVDSLASRVNPARPGDLVDLPVLTSLTRFALPEILNVCLCFIFDEYVDKQPVGWFGLVWLGLVWLDWMVSILFLNNASFHVNT